MKKNNMTNCNEKIGSRLAELRKARKIKQVQLALELHMGSDGSGISNIERGKTMLQAEQIISFSKYFGVPSDYILGIENTHSNNCIDLTGIDTESQKFLFHFALMAKRIGKK